MADPSVLNERAQALLKQLVERYIEDGQPVGSRTLSKSGDIKGSPATIRNIMADLEDLGLITSPHTSAGRVPTAAGYRMFVDNLLTVKPLRGNTIDQLKDKLKLELSQGTKPERLIESASGLLSSMTQMAGVVMLPRHEVNSLRHIEFMPLSSKRILVILVINNEQVQNRVIHTEKPYTPAELQTVANFINTEFAGRDLKTIRDSVAKSMQQIRDDMQQLLTATADLADEVVRSSSDNYVVSGETNLMGYQEMADIERLRSLFEALNTRRDILHVLDKSIHAEGMQIFIGEESGYSAFGECSVVTSPYKVEGQTVGVLGVIGPTRMAYDRVIPVVDVTAKLLGSLLTSG